jgi:hypothetical protein
MLSRKIDSPSWREGSMARTVSSSETVGGSSSAPSGEYLQAPIETAAWDPYEVWLTRVKQPRDAQRK